MKFLPTFKALRSKSYNVTIATTILPLTQRQLKYWYKNTEAPDVYIGFGCYLFVLEELSMIDFIVRLILSLADAIRKGKGGL